ncbi:hypothetical protein NMG60_11003132 [Bertholletia excelsa]
MIQLPCQLGSLDIVDCANVEVIISIRGKEKEATASNNDAIKFPALKYLTLVGLRNFKKFYSPLMEGQYLFNHQVSFPVLGYLSIQRLTDIIKIWEVESMIQLPSQLRLLEIRDCANVEVIISIRGKEKGAIASNNDAIKFPALGNLTLEGLPNFKKFYSPLMEGQYLFNHQVSFPVLTYLIICGLTNIIKIWEVESMIQLPSQLLSLSIRDCANVEVIISIRGKEKEATASNNVAIKFLALGYLSLEGLPNFKKFYSPLMEGQYLFNHQVEFPCLLQLTISAVTNIEEIWSDTLPVNSFGQLIRVELRDCNKITSLASSKLVARFQRLQYLNITQCDSLQVVFRAEGRNKAGTNAGEFMFPPQLRELKIEDLPNLESFFSEPPLLQLPSTVTLIEENCPKWRHLPNC